MLIFQNKFYLDKKHIKFDLWIWSKSCGEKRESSPKVTISGSGAVQIRDLLTMLLQLSPDIKTEEKKINKHIN